MSANWWVDAARNRHRECHLGLGTDLSSSPGKPVPAISSEGCGATACNKAEPVLWFSPTTTLAAASTPNSATLLDKPVTCELANVIIVLKTFPAIPGTVQNYLCSIDWLDSLVIS